VIASAAREDLDWMPARREAFGELPDDRLGAADDVRAVPRHDERDAPAIIRAQLVVPFQGHVA